MRLASWWTGEGEGKVRCGLCPHRCLIAPGRRGVCGVRENRAGELYSLVWGKAVAMAVDPIEKKPLFHVLPGTPIFSLAAAGCNFRCRHCQNADISQPPREDGRIPGREALPAEVVALAEREGCRSVACTYTEPSVWLEYARDVFLPAKERGMTTALVTNGYVEADPLREIAPHLDAANVDLKAFSEDFYRKVCGARLQPVLDSLLLYRELGVWIEVTTLLIPGLNDSEEELREVARFIRSLGPEVPWHVSRFHPDYHMLDRPATPPETVRRAWEIGREEGLLHVYQGNIAGGGGEDTFCPNCGRTVVSRAGFALRGMALKGGACSYCGAAVHGIWE